MSGFIGALKSGIDLMKRGDDDSYDRLSSRYSVAICLVFAFLVSGGEIGVVNENTAAIKMNFSKSKKVGFTVCYELQPKEGYSLPKMIHEGGHKLNERQLAQLSAFFPRK